METHQKLTSKLSLSNSSHPCVCLRVCVCLRTLHPNWIMNNSNILSHISRCLSYVPPAVMWHKQAGEEEGDEEDEGSRGKIGVDEKRWVG